MARPGHDRAGPSHADVHRFDRWARRYDRGLRARFFFRPLHRRLVAALDARRGERVLDVGAGTGSIVASLAASGARAVGADPSVEMVRVGSLKVPGRLVAAAAEALPFADARFDAVLTSMSLHHWGSVPAGLAEVARVLRPGGRALVADLESPGVLPSIVHALARLRSRSPRPSYQSRREMAGALEAVGLTVGKQERAGRVLVTVATRRDE